MLGDSPEFDIYGSKRFNRRKSLNIGKKFMRIVQQAAKSNPITWGKIQKDLDPISKFIAVTGAS
jgi:hypothetical protein